jgi:hypothetical protein
MGRAIPDLVHAYVAQEGKVKLEALISDFMYFEAHTSCI